MKKSNQKKEDSTSLISKFEDEALEAWHMAMGNRKISFKVSLTEAGLCAERICQAAYIRKYGKKPTLTFFQTINLLVNEGVFDLQIKTYMNTVRPSSAQRRHDVTHLQKAFIDVMRLNLIEIMLWYQRYAQMKFEGLNLNKYRQMLNHKPVSTLYKLKEKGKITEESFEENMKNESFVNYNIQDKKLLHNPVFASLIIDASGSMSVYTRKVIDAHQEALNAIRGSMICKKRALYLMQHLFSSQGHLLNALSLVDQDGQDNIAPVNSDTYHAGGATALYDTLYDAIMMLCLEADSLKSTKGRKPEIIIGIITDGKDNASKKKAAEIRKLLEYLKEDRAVKSSVVIGWTDNQEFNNNDLESLRESLGFDEYIALDKADPSSIRNAFQLWSQYVA